MYNIKYYVVEGSVSAVFVVYFFPFFFLPPPIWGEGYPVYRSVLLYVLHRNGVFFRFDTNITRVIIIIYRDSNNTLWNILLRSARRRRKSFFFVFSSSKFQVHTRPYAYSYPEAPLMAHSSLGSTITVVRTRLENSTSNSDRGLWKKRKKTTKIATVVPEHRTFFHKFVFVHFEQRENRLVSSTSVHTMVLDERDVFHKKKKIRLPACKTCTTVRTNDYYNYRKKSFFNFFFFFLKVVYKLKILPLGARGRQVISTERVETI